MPKTPRGPSSAIRVGSTVIGNEKFSNVRRNLATTPTTASKGKTTPIVIAPKNTQKSMKPEIWSSPAVFMDHQYGQTPEYLYLAKNPRFTQSRAQVCVIMSTTTKE